MARESDLAYWLDVTTELLQRPLTEFPAADLAVHLTHSFELTSLIWKWHESEDEYGFGHFSGDDASFTPGTEESSTAHSEQDTPVLDRDWLDEHRHLSILYCMHGVSYGVFVLTRPGAHFDGEEMDLARRLQRLIAGLYVQVRDPERTGQVPSGTAAQVGLTGTEFAVLTYLARGFTAQGIARRLSNSPRTVHKHLEHIYRKLGVSDRLMAVQVATELGVPTAVHPEAEMHGTGAGVFRRT